MAQRETQALNAEAARWLAKRQRDDFTPADGAEFDRWLDADPAHAVAFARTEAAWDRAQRLRARPLVGGARLASPWFFTAHRAIAAAVAIVAMGAILWWVLRDSTIYATDVGEQQIVSLEDGSRVTLNTASRIDVDFTPDRRTVRLSAGEALFNVAKDSSRPFLVEANGTVVRAVGTAFNVRLRDRTVEVTVTEGVVTVNEAAAAGARTPSLSRVAAGSSVVVGPADTVTPVALDQDVLRRRLAWRDGVIELKGETLEEALEEFNRYRSARLVIADSRIAAIRVGGRFENDEADKFLAAVKQSFPIRFVEAADGTIYLLQAE